MLLVTGATGHIGKELVPLLLEAGEPVRVLTRDERKVAHLAPRVERALGACVLLARVRVKTQTSARSDGQPSAFSTADYSG